MSKDKTNDDLSLPVVIEWRDKNGVGRPTKYHPIFCLDVIDHMSKGGTVTSFPGYLYRKHRVKIHLDTIYQWQKVFPEFSEALDIGKSCALDFFEQVSIKAMRGRLKLGKKDGYKIAHFHFKVWAMHMINRYDWKTSDRKQIDNTLANAAKIDEMNEMIADKQITVNLIIPDNGRKNS